MGLSFTEELVSEYYRHDLDRKGRPKYLVSEHVQYQMPKRGVKVRGWHDIDILAIGQREIHIVQAKQYAVFENTTKESIISLGEYFKDAEKFVRQNYAAKNKKIRWVFVAESMSKNMHRELNRKGIKADWVKNVIKRFLQTLYERWEPEYEKTGNISIGKEESNLTRLLLSLTLYFDDQLVKSGLLTGL